MEIDNEFYELISGQLREAQRQVAESKRGLAEPADRSHHEIVELARTLVAADDALDDLIHGPMFPWLVATGLERKDERTDWTKLMLDYADNRWLPVLYDVEGTPFNPQTADALSIQIAAVELCSFEGDGTVRGREAARECVVNALDARHGEGASADFDVDWIIDTMVEIDMPTPDEWDFASFWLIVEQSRLTADG